MSWEEEFLRLYPLILAACVIGLFLISQSRIAKLEKRVAELERNMT